MKRLSLIVLFAFATLNTPFAQSQPGAPNPASDDLQQPIDFQAAADFNRVYLRIAQAVANRNERPQWRADSFFRRFMP